MRSMISRSLRPRIPIHQPRINAPHFSGLSRTLASVTPKTPSIEVVSSREAKCQPQLGGRGFATTAYPKVIHNANAACCSIPPVDSKSKYTPKGWYTEMGGYKTYSAGDPASKKALICVFDIFGFWPQTLQGADLLASKDFYVVMPDWFHGKPFPMEEFPPDTDEKKQHLQEFFGSTAKPDNVLPGVLRVADHLRKLGFYSIGIYGFCWGGKIVSLVSQGVTTFNAAAQVHPAMLDPEEAKRISIPFAIFPSKDEDPSAVEQFVRNLETNSSPLVKERSVYKKYDSVHHGFAAARADLENEENKKQYEDVYKRLAGFFTANL